MKENLINTFRSKENKYNTGRTLNVTVTIKSRKKKQLLIHSAEIILCDTTKTLGRILLSIFLYSRDEETYSTYLSFLSNTLEAHIFKCP